MNITVTQTVPAGARARCRKLTADRWPDGLPYVAIVGTTYDEHPERRTLAQAVNFRMYVPSEIRIPLRQHPTLRSRL